MHDTPEPHIDVTGNLRRTVELPSVRIESPQLRQGVITAYDVATRTCSAQLGGDTTTTIDGVAVLEDVLPIVGSTVWMLQNPTDLMVIGALANRARGVRLRRVANQSINTNSVTSISWDTEDDDTDGFITPTSATVTIPTGLGGLYAITFYATGVLTAAGQRGFGQIIPTSSITGMPTGFRVDLNEEEDSVTVAVTIPLLAGDLFVCRLYHNEGNAVNFTAWLSCYRVGA